MLAPLPPPVCSRMHSLLFVIGGKESLFPKDVAKFREPPAMGHRPVSPFEARILWIREPRIFSTELADWRNSANFGTIDLCADLKLTRLSKANCYPSRKSPQEELRQVKAETVNRDDVRRSLSAFARLK